jgi:outer membrane protein OmpA-like peptidoglycan-associated protein
MSHRFLLTFCMTLCACTMLAIRLYPNGFSVSEPPKNLGPPVNGPRNDFAPAVSPDGSFMIFNSNRNGRYQDLFVTRLVNGKWTNPEPLEAVNSPYNDETPFLSSDGSVLLFSSDRDGSIEMPPDSRNRVRISFDIYWSKRTENGWSAPAPLPGDVNTMHHERTPSLSRDGKTLYFCRWHFGGMEKTRLMSAEFKDGRFVNARPMPAPFNTGSKDVALIPAEDLGGFFFSSNRPGGLGMFDIYFVSYRNGAFGEPVNLGPMVNSSANELYLARADQRYFICSNRSGGQGRFDIYSSFIFSKEEPRFETRAIHFDFDKAVIREESYPYLDALFKFLKGHGNAEVEITGHTDLHGTGEYNNRLSLQRAEAVKSYLTRRGLDPNRIKIFGAGKSRPVVNRVGTGFDELNRRTEFRISKQAT